MRDRYNGGFDPSETGANHIIDTETKDGQEYLYCKACNFGVPLTTEMSQNRAENKLNELSCPPTEDEKESLRIEKKGFILP